MSISLNVGTHEFTVIVTCEDGAFWNAKAEFSTFEYRSGIDVGSQFLRSYAPTFEGAVKNLYRELKRDYGDVDKASIQGTTFDRPALEVVELAVEKALLAQDWVLANLEDSSGPTPEVRFRSYYLPAVCKELRSHGWAFHEFMGILRPGELLTHRVWEAHTQKHVLGGRAGLPPDGRFYPLSMRTERRALCAKMIADGTYEKSTSHYLT